MMYVDVSLEVDGASDAVLIPAEAVLHSGERSVVIVEKDDGLFEPREVSLGLAAEGLQEITEGLSPGETVVVSSQFLIDSESNLEAAAAQLLRGDEPDDAPDETDATPPPSPLSGQPCSNASSTGPSKTGFWSSSQPFWSRRRAAIPSCGRR